MTLEIVQIPVWVDNYVYLIRSGEGAAAQVAVVDPAESNTVREELSRRGWTLHYILNTHHHFDHVGGNQALKREFGCTIVGPQADQDRIPGIDIALSDGDRFALGGGEAEIFDTPGHTRGHICFLFREEDALFCGDTLFSVGCGRLFEGTPAQMWRSLCKLRDLPLTTRVYCAHEYTADNVRFALTVDPDNPDLQEWAGEVARLRQAGRPTIPTTIGRERRTNPFLRADDPGLAAAVGGTATLPDEVFAEVRSRKDRFR